VHFPKRPNDFKPTWRILMALHVGFLTWASQPGPFLNDHFQGIRALPQAFFSPRGSLTLNQSIRDFLSWFPTHTFPIYPSTPSHTMSGWPPPEASSPSVSLISAHLSFIVLTIILPLVFSFYFHRVGYLSRKALPIKRNDAEPLTREDVQYDLLTYLFTEPTAVFTKPPGSGGGKQQEEDKVAFGDLYVSTLYSSHRCSKVLKGKMHDTPAFSVEFAKLALLTNVGRINTTMACKGKTLSFFFSFAPSPPTRCPVPFILCLLFSLFRDLMDDITVFPEMKTALRTYHPVPSLQKTDGNAQDAPRIKNCLKAALLPSELRTMPPTTPEEILQKLVLPSPLPPVSFVLCHYFLSCLEIGSTTTYERCQSHFRTGQSRCCEWSPRAPFYYTTTLTQSAHQPLSSTHFDGNLNFLDLFLSNTGLPSAGRGRAFLWLLYHYLESNTGPNPFDDQYSTRHPGKIPLLRTLSIAEHDRENVDTREEIEWGNNMSLQRNLFLQKLVVEPDRVKNKPHAHYVTGSFSLSLSFGVLCLVQT
jgi:Ino eighty subunit 1